MFIHGGNNSETPNLDSVDRSSLTKRVNYLQRLRENLRQRFRNEYLALLVHRGIRRNDVLNVGDLVFIGHDNAKRIDCPLGIIVEIFLGKNGVPRVTRLRTYKEERIHPFQRLFQRHLEVSAKTDAVVSKAARPTDSSSENTDTVRMRHHAFGSVCQN
ncbi:hypothetical protein HNY73_007399 [Argiope bruennichi]|uniref:DUF5641 domain-containing protein n=1 Tax=Argiope bruennichi TaxID=94029 RepID=A0A8T0FGE6_ARGBR|nr:hypothetical protein HNY73_007399 [Argiope bruennichi]